MKRILAFVMVLTIILSCGVSVFAYSEINTVDVKQMFEKNMEDKIKSVKGPEKEIVEKDFRKYKTLCDFEKEKFIEYISDPELVIKLLSISISQPNSGKTLKTTKKISEDIAIEETVEKSSLSDNFYDSQTSIPSVSKTEISIETTTTLSRAGTSVESAINKRSVSFFGIKVMEITSRIIYRLSGGTGGRITGVIGGAHYLSRNYTLNRITFHYNWEDYSSRLATSRSYFTASFVFKNIFTIADGTRYIQVDNYKNSWGGIYGLSWF